MTFTIPADRTSEVYADKPYPDRDIATIGDNGGVRFLFDLAFPYSYPAGAYTGRAAAGNPADNAVIQNMARQGNSDGNGQALVVTENGSTLPFSGGGFSLSNTIPSVTYGGSGVAGPAAALADIWNAAPAGAFNVGASQQFLWVGYFRLPTTANWGASGAIRPVFSASGVTGGYATPAPDMLNIAMRSGSPYQIDARRPISSGVVESTIILQPQAGDYGSLVQMAYWRNASGSVFRLQSAAGIVKSAPTIYAASSSNFSALVPVWGHPMGFVTTSDGYSGAKVYRGWLENLARSGRDPEAVLAADWADVTRRNALGLGFS